MTVRLHKESNKINTNRRVRQRDTILPTLFMAALPSIFRWLTWETRGFKIDGEYLNHLRFADDIPICANTTTYSYALQQMLQELADESENQGLKMNKGDDGKRHTNIRQQQSDRERWKRHLPGTETRYSTRDKNQDKEIQRRITAGWRAFVKHRDIFKGNIGTCLKRQVYNSCVLPAMT